MLEFDPYDWFWVVGDGDARLWSSIAGAYVATLPAGAGVTRIASEAELTDVLRGFGLPGPAPTVEDVKAEAARRILAIMPDYQQRNALAMFAEAAQLHGPDPANWPPELQAVNADVMAKWAAIKAIRQRSDEIEAMQPVPADFRSDEHWET